MDREWLGRRRVGWALALTVFAAAASAGCQTVKTPEEKIAKSNIPGEFKKVSMPDYVIEPPDIVIVEVLEALPGRPISGERLVRPDGKITLGFYGEVYLTGLKLDEAKEKIVLHLRKFLTDEALGLVKQDDPNSDKVIPVPPMESDRVFIDVVGYNSKYYFVLGDVGSPGRLSVTGNETVLDAIQLAGGLIGTAAPQNIRLVRPAPPGACCEQVLPVNLAAIVNVGDSTTNYQLMPGDRLVVYRDPIVRTTLFIDRLAAPFQTVVNSILTYSFTARQVETLGTPINGFGNNTNNNTNNRGRNNRAVSPGAR